MSALQIKDATGRVHRLAFSRTNQLRVAVVEQFAPRFAPRAKLIYMRCAVGMPSAGDKFIGPRQPPKRKGK